MGNFFFGGGVTESHVGSNCLVVNDDPELLMMLALYLKCWNSRNEYNA